MSEPHKIDTCTLSELPPKVLEEVIRQFRAARNDILRYGTWNLKSLTDQDFNSFDDQKLFDYFRQDLLETRFVDRGRRLDIIQVWQLFEHQIDGTDALLIDGEEYVLDVQDKDIEKARKRISELASFLPTLRAADFDGFRRIKYKLRRVVMRLTYDIHHLNKRLEKHRKQKGVVSPRTAHIDPQPDTEETPEAVADDVETDAEDQV